MQAKSGEKENPSRNARTNSTCNTLPEEDERATQQHILNKDFSDKSYSVLDPVDHNSPKKTQSRLKTKPGRKKKAPVTKFDFSVLKKARETQSEGTSESWLKLKLSHR